MTIPLSTHRPYLSNTNDRLIASVVGLIDHYLSETLTLIRSSGMGPRNEPKYTKIENIPCRWTECEEKITKSDGNQVIAKGKIYMSLSEEVKVPNDYIIYDGIKYNILKVDIPTSFINSHQEVYVA